MRSAAALASALEEVAQVRYSRSGSSRGLAAAEPGFGTDRQQRQRLGDIIDRAERVQRTGSGKTNFVNARARSAPRYFRHAPARGYRFHSLQVEIIADPLAARRPLIFASNYLPFSADLCRDLNALLPKSVSLAIAQQHSRLMHRRVTSLGRAIHRKLWPSVAVRYPLTAFSVSGRPSSRDRDRPGAPDAACLRDGNGREEDRATTKKHNRRRPHAKQSSDRSASASEKRRQGNSRRGRHGRQQARR